MKNLGYLYNKLYYNFDNNKNFFNTIKNFKKKDSKKKYSDVLYEDILKNLDKGHYINLNKAILQYNSSGLIEINNLSGVNDVYPLKFKTTYPGLLAGTGYNHDMKANEFFKMGMSFDYTTGLPVIQGSSIKGLLRSAFPSIYEKEAEINEKERNVYNEMKNERIKYILEKLNKIEGINKDIINESFVLKLEKELFDGIICVKDKEYNISPINRDTFFDAEINKEESKSNFILSEDYLAPHAEELKNPKPIKFVKVSPEIVFDFKFKLPEFYSGVIYEEKSEKIIRENNIKSTLTPIQKLELFKEIILDLGAGAKTNLGYGRFNEEYTNIKLESFKNCVEEKKQLEIKKKQEEIYNNMTDAQKIVFRLNKANDIQSELKNVLEDLKAIQCSEEQTIIASRIKEVLEERSLWNPKNKKQEKKIEEIKSYL